MTAMNAAQVMTRRVISTTSDTPILEAIRIMLQNRISGLPVIEANGTLVGIVTEGDFLHRAENDTERRRSLWQQFLAGPGKLASDYVHSHGRKVAEVMTTNVQTITEDTTLNQIAAIMEKCKVKRLPVLRDDKVVGVVTRANLMHALVTLALQSRPVAQDDVGIRENLLAELSKEKWAPTSLINVEVHDGVVGLRGIILDERDRMALKVAAENIPGVTAVQDRLTWVDPISGTAVDSDGTLIAPNDGL